MDSNPHGQPGRALIVLAIAVALVQSSQVQELLSAATRVSVVASLRLVDIEATVLEGNLEVSGVPIPWARDCSGFNGLAILWGMVLWLNRSRLFSSRVLLQMAAAIPVALSANAARVLSIVAWRLIRAPEVESPQLHTFFGFAWLLPALLVFLPRPSTLGANRYLEGFHFAAALALLTPHLHGPAGLFVTLCTILALALATGGRSQPVSFSALASGIWLAACAFISFTSMESLWLPWILLCPWNASRQLMNLSGLSLVSGSVPFVALQCPWIAMPGIAIILWRFFSSRGRNAAEASGREPLTSGRSSNPCLAGARIASLLLPFALPALLQAPVTPQVPPAGSMSKRIAPHSHAVSLVGQPVEVRLTWHEPTGTGRHHSLPVCMHYHGVTLSPASPGSDILTDGQSWMLERFLLAGSPPLHYVDYLRATFRPFSESGVHLIASAPCHSISAARFQAESENLFRRLADLRTPPKS